MKHLEVRLSRDSSSPLNTHGMVCSSWTSPSSCPKESTLSNCCKCVWGPLDFKTWILMVGRGLGIRCFNCSVIREVHRVFRWGGQCGSFLNHLPCLPRVCACCVYVFVCVCVFVFVYMCVNVYMCACVYMLKKGWRKTTLWEVGFDQPRWLVDPLVIQCPKLAPLSIQFYNFPCKNRR